MFTSIILIIHLLVSLVVWIYYAFQFFLAIVYIQGKRKVTTQAPPLYNPLTTPKVTIQVPMYNEMYVAERIIEKVANLDYPKEKLQIQILDDSTDETQDLAAKKVAELATRGINIQYIHRDNRTGFKAGALNAAMNHVESEFIAILDADFAPDSDWLQKTMPYFEDASIAVVQTRWGHLNKNYSLLTKVQAFFLDLHFKTEQTGKQLKSLPVLYNGSGGIWRKICIEDAGGWSGNMLLEDKDLSYRVLTKGWKFKYLEDVVAEAELPITLSAFIIQQRRWMKGGNECFLKLWKSVLRSNKLNLSSKIYGLIDLFRWNFMVLSFFKLTTMLILSLMNYKWAGSFFFYFVLPAIDFSGLLLIAYVFWSSYDDKTSKKFMNLISFINRFLQSSMITIGISYRLTVAIFESYFGIKSAFIRTPKFNFSCKNDIKKNKYNKKKFSLTTLIEGILMVVCGYTFIRQMNHNNCYGMGLLLLATLGYAFVFFTSIKETINYFSFKKNNNSSVDCVAKV